MIKLPLLEDVQKESLKGKRVYCRVDLNLSLDKNGQVADDFRLETALPTINFLKEAGAKVILGSHFKKDKTENTLAPISEFVSGKLKHKFLQTPYPSKEAGAEIDSLKDGEVILLENIRLNEGEKENDFDYARRLSEMFDFFVNESFSDAHRDHASVSGVPKFLNGYAGFQFTREVKRLSEAFDPPKPFLFILGGAKFETKLPLIEKFLEKADTVFVGGALSNDILNELGEEIGDSLVSKEKLDLSTLARHESLFIPNDFWVETKNGQKVQKNIGEIENGDTIWDSGPETLKKINGKIKEAKFILWNGPLGNYEIGYKDSTNELAKMIADSPAESIVGGGDTRAAISNLGLFDQFSFVSTGGGAMLDFLANGTLPGIEALRK